MNIVENIWIEGSVEAENFSYYTIEVENINLELTIV